MVPSTAAAEAYRSVLISYHSSLKYAIVPIIHDTETIRRNAETVIKTGEAWRSKFVPSAWEKILLFVGRITKVKNLHWLIDRMAKLDDRIGLVLVGGGDEEEVLKAKVAESRLSNQVLFAGKKMGDDLYAVMSAADALVLPSTFEPYGAVVPEAMQWGTPCIVRDTCGCKVLVNGKNGIVYRSDDDFEDAICKVLAMKNGSQSILPVELNKSVEDFVAEIDRCCE